MQNTVQQHEYYSLTLISYTGDRIALLRKVRNILNCSLEIGKKFLGTTNTVILYTNTEAQANNIKTRMAQIGIQIEVAKITLSNKPYDLYPDCRGNSLESTKGKSKFITLVLCFFLGWCGMHKFYLKEKSAWLYFLFFWTGLPALFAIWDFLTILISLIPEQEDRLNKVLEDNSFEATKIIEIKRDVLIIFDDSKNKIMFYYDNLSTTPEIKIIDYKDILDVELCTDGNSKLQGRGMLSAVGAYTFGITGAIIGTVAGDRKVLESATSIVVNIQVSNLQNPLISVVFLDREVEKSNSDYREAISNAQNFIATLTYAKNKAKKTVEQ